MRFGIFTTCFGYERFLPEWEASIAEMDPSPDEVVIVGDHCAWDAWGGTGAFVAAPELGEPFRDAASQNVAVRAMTADWVMQVGVDDLIVPSLVAEFAPFFDFADVIACNNRRERDGKPMGERVNRPSRASILSPTMGRQPLDACAAFRRSFWEQAPFDERIDDLPFMCADVALWIGFAKRGARFASTGKVGIRYRLHDDSAWHSTSKEQTRAAREYLNKLRLTG